MRAHGLYTFAAQAKGQLSFQVNEEFLLLREDTALPGWGYAKNGLGQEGYVPLSYCSYKANSSPLLTRAKEAPRVTTVARERQELLDWVTGRIPDYHVRDFGPSWRDGRALMALCNALRPGTFEIPAQFGTAEENVALAIEAAEKHLRIEATVNALEVTDPRFPEDRLELYVRSFRVKQRQLLEEADAEERLRRREGGLYKQARAKPNKADVWCNIVSKSGKYHASIDFDGVVSDRFGDCIGYLNLETFQAASRAQELIGYVVEGSVYDCRTGGKGVFCGELNRGVGSIHDANGSTVVEVDGQGACRGQTGVYLGCFEECSRRELDIIALYCFFIDPDFKNEELEDEPEKQLVEPPENAFCNIYGKAGEFHASIAEDGAVTNCFGEPLGFLDLVGRRAASASGELRALVLGSQIVAANDDVIGEMDRGKGLVFDASGSSVLLLEASGHCKGATQVYLGEFRGCTFKELDLIALYILTLDESFRKED